MPRGADPLGPDNELIVGTGLLTGTLGPGTGRFTVTAKSPLTGIHGDANCEGDFGPELKYAEYDYIVISGKAEKLFCTGPLAGVVCGPLWDRRI